jgi:hypothetical protein
MKLVEFWYAVCMPLLTEFQTNDTHDMDPLASCGIKYYLAEETFITFFSTNTCHNCIHEEIKERENLGKSLLPFSSDSLVFQSHP